MDGLAGNSVTVEPSRCIALKSSRGSMDIETGPLRLYSWVPSIAEVIAAIPFGITSVAACTWQL